MYRSRIVLIDDVVDEKEIDPGTPYPGTFQPVANGARTSAMSY